ncbi:MAG: HEAT repeat domain-containing protein [Candidatus Rokubacteria bacterium]|nr:HEAT repeat domain-containing protein [Candidatus Rokubacteria bacterium]
MQDLTPIHGDDRALEALLAALRDQNWFVRMRAVKLLAALRQPGAAEALETAARSDDDEDVREEALVALATLAPERALPALLRGLRDEDSWVRERVASLLGELGDRRALPALLRAMQGREEDVAAAAADAVEKLTSAAAGGPKAERRKD